MIPNYRRSAPRARRRVVARPGVPEPLEARVLLTLAGGLHATEVIGRAADGVWWTGHDDGGGMTSRPFAAWHPDVDWRDVAAADFDGDRLDDVAGRDPATGAWYVSLSDGVGSTTLLAARLPGRPAGVTLSTASIEIIAARERRTAIYRAKSDRRGVAASRRHGPAHTVTVPSRSPSHRCVPSGR